MTHFVGIDFGTTNSAVAVAGDDGVRLVQLPGPDGAPSPTWRTVLYFDPEEREVRAGPEAIAAYLEAEGQGRLIQSIKSHLASASFTRTAILNRTYSLEQLIAIYLRKLRAAAGLDLGRRAVVGRPVHYWGAEDEADDARAVSRMREALGLAGFDEVVFDHEPIGAAARYATRLDHREIVLVADFGGGTSDFSLLEVGRGTTGDILATGGLAVGGDSFDARIIDSMVAPALGRGTTFVAEMGAETPVPVWLFNRLRRWHHLSFLKVPETMRLLERIEHGARAPERIERLLSLVRDDLGLSLQQAVERCKIALSAGERGALELDALGLAGSASRPGFEEWIAPDLAAISGVVDGVLADAGASPSDVDRVFATGGSSMVPAVRTLLASRFGADRVAGGEELTSVCLGLAARAAARFGA